MFGELLTGSQQLNLQASLAVINSERHSVAKSANGDVKNFAEL